MVPGIDPTVDYVFKLVFGVQQNSDLLISLLNAVLDPPAGRRVAAVTILNPFNEKEALDDKLSILDIKAQDQSGRLFNVEIQILVSQWISKRVLYYWAKLYSQQLEEGQQYHELCPTVSVVFLGGELFPDIDDFHLEFRLRDRGGELEFSDDIQMHTIELPKFERRAAELTNDLDRWIYFLCNGAELDTEALPSNLSLPEYQKAMGILKRVSEVEQERQRYEARMAALRDERSWRRDAEEFRKLQQRADDEKQRADEAERRAQENFERGVLLGVIQSYERQPGRSLTPHEQLLAKSSAELQIMADELARELADQKDD